MSPPRNFTVLENNPESLNFLAHKLGLSPTLAFHDVYSLHDPDLLTHIPRPVYALLAIIPLTPTWSQDREQEDSALPPSYQYPESGPSERVLWFKQTMHNGCGSIGLLHCIGSGAARDMVLPQTALNQLLEAAAPLNVNDRAELLNSSDALFEAHQMAAAMGDSRDPGLGPEEHAGLHFVAFVKGRDGRLWELEGVRKGPLDRGLLGEGEDALSPRAVEVGIGRLIEMERASGGGDLRFSCVALAPAE